MSHSSHSPRTNVGGCLRERLKTGTLRTTHAASHSFWCVAAPSKLRRGFIRGVGASFLGSCLGKRPRGLWGTWRDSGSGHSPARWLGCWRRKASSGVLWTGKFCLVQDISYLSLTHAVLEYLVRFWAEINAGMPAFPPRASRCRTPAGLTLFRHCQLIHPFGPFFLGTLAYLHWNPSQLVLMATAQPATWLREVRSKIWPSNF